MRSPAQLQMDWDREEWDNALEAQAIQHEFEQEDAQLVAQRAALQKEAQVPFDCGDCFDHAYLRASSGVSSHSSYAQAVTPPPKVSDVAVDDHAVAAQLQMDWDREERDSALKAQAMQYEFEQEDAQLVRQQVALQKQAQLLFDCGVCLDKWPEDYVCRIQDCTHAFCRDCMKGYVVSKLQDKLYPIFCPMCVTDQARVEPGVITDDLVQMLGLDDKNYHILQELQIASMSILLHCRQCKESVFVDRAEYEEAPVLVCPLPRCNYAWCKSCQQTISMKGPKHSCDGSSELEHLMKRRGWKHCPG
ncbi:RING-type domain-containing protein [Mycena sanguinolenta]|uniref:RING-type domain-containing protein n=1 Tax=Mycena sanguinolenta TaxID=230812 RepID=A0A8H6Z159_9AGAR|nr:RING-type domain-containing protein [Mycena sanguinolenta]